MYDVYVCLSLNYTHNMFHLWLTTFNNAEWEKLKNFFNQATVWIDGSIDRQSFNSLREREKDKYVYTDDIH